MRIEIRNSVKRAVCSCYRHNSESGNLKLGREKPTEFTAKGCDRRGHRDTQRWTDLGRGNHQDAANGEKKKKILCFVAPCPRLCHLLWWQEGTDHKMLSEIFIC